MVERNPGRLLSLVRGQHDVGGRDDLDHAERLLGQDQTAGILALISCAS